MARLIVVDESLHKRLATELDRRGRRATTIGALGLRGADDPAVLEELTQREPDTVLVSGDINMPRDHADAIARSTVSVCITDPLPRGSALSEDQWRSEIVHRWVHRMVDQAPASAFVYGPRGGRLWKPRRRKAPHGPT